MMERSVIDRIRQYAGKDRNQVVNPNITTREAILIADHIQEIESSLESHHRDLLKIHRVAAAVAQVEPITEDDTLTVKRVKQMAMMINHLSPVAEVNPEMTAKVPEGYTPVRTLVLKWLLGETEAFEPVEGERGQFWWRSRLREALLTTPHLPPRQKREDK